MARTGASRTRSRGPRFQRPWPSKPTSRRRPKDGIAANACTVGACLDEIVALGLETGWSDAAGRGPTDVVTLMDELESDQNEEPSRLPAVCLRAFAIVAAIGRTGVLKAIDGPHRAVSRNRADRFPIEAMVTQLDEMRDRLLVYLWRRLIEIWIIGQHTFWSAVRNGDGKQRLRITLDDDGRVRLRPPSRRGFAPTPDRLATLFALGSECGLFTRSSNGGVDVFGLSALSDSQ